VLDHGDWSHQSLLAEGEGEGSGGGSGSSSGGGCDGNNSISVTASGAGEMEVVIPDITATSGDGCTLVSVTVAWGDGDSHEYLPEETPEHGYRDDDPTATPSDQYTITVTGTWDGGYTATDSTTITVSNRAPTAFPESALIHEDTGIEFWVLTNDTDPSHHDVLSVVSFDATMTVGSVVHHGGGHFVYDPGNEFDYLDAGETATDTLTYTIADDDDPSATSTATVTVTIEGRPDIELREHAIYGWEAQDLNIYASAVSLDPDSGDVAEYGLDVDRDGTVDWIGSHIPEIDGALEFNLGLLGLLGDPADDDTYLATLWVTTDAGVSDSFEVDIRIGNMPPEITFSSTTEGEPDVPFFLDVSTSNPGPDTVTQILVEWGDGASSTIRGGAGTVSHVYPTDGKYTIRATATDEDDSYWAELRIDIGDTNAPIVESGDPEIISAIATILPNGNASLTVDAVDSAGSPNVTYEWDIDGDGAFEHSGTNTVELTPGPDFYPYSATVRVTDAVGRFTEALFGFMQAGNQAAQGTKNTAGPNFRSATPNMPPDWKVHHKIQHHQDVLAARYWKERGVNLHALDNLVGVPDSVHKEINAAQQAFWLEKAKEGKNATNIPLAEVDDFAAKLEVEFGSRWISAGATSRDVTKVKNLVQNAAARFGIDKANRWKRLGLTVTAALPIAGVLLSNAEAMAQMKNFNPDTHPEFLAFMDQYEMALQDAIKGDLRQPRGWHLIDAFTAFAKSLALDVDAINKMKYAMTVWVGAHLPP
jgi:VCBS repeat-containing protein